MGRDHLHEDTTVDPSSPLSHRVALQVPGFVAVVVLWVALWGEPSAANVLGGAAVAAVVVAAFHPGRRERLGRLRPLAAARFVAAVAVNLAQSTLVVAWEIVTHTDRTRPGILAVELPSATPVVLTAVTTAVGLTPGTLVVDVDRDPTVVYVHVLHLRDPALERRRIRHLEALALAAFGPADAADDIAALLGGAGEEGS
jgi:multicomponent Na+:H+ antiporter subunit E